MLWRIEQTSSESAGSPARFVRRSVFGQTLTVLCAGLALWVTATHANAQSQRRYFPLDQNTPPGVAGRWAGLLGKADGFYFQPVRVELPEAGDVTFYGAGQQATEFAAPGQAGMLAGYVYRIKISNIPRFPGAELYPTIELLDRLHPPRGRAADFPIPITFSNEEIELALNGRLITKVVYLEQPQLANPIKLDETVPVDVLGPHENAIAVADYYGRPMAIVRLGGRIPLLNGNNADFYGDGAPIAASVPNTTENDTTAELGRMITK